MNHSLAIILAGALLFTGCAKMANMANVASSEYFIEECVAAEKGARLLDVEAICSNAIMNVDWSKQKPELKSERYYNLGRTKRQLYKFSEAIFLFKESLAIEERAPQSSELRIGHRLVELSLSLAGHKEWEEGASYLIRALPIIPQFAGEERMLATKVLKVYGAYFRKQYQMDVAELFENSAAALY